MRIYSLLLVLVAACTFNERDFGDRLCTGAQDCPRPDQACVQNTCTQKSCSNEAACGTGYDFECAAGACVVDTCSGAGDCQLGFACENGYCAASFNVQGVTPTSNRSIAVTFDAPPDEASAITLANYTVDGLALSGTPSLSGSTVTLTTSVQAGGSYTATVANVIRAGDQAPLKIATGMFTGRRPFGVASATSTSSVTVQITFDAPPDVAATNLASYAITGLTLSGTPVVNGNAVTLTTSPQTSQQMYMVTVTSVRRAGDLEPLSNNLASFLGRAGFNLMRAEAKRSNTIEVEFDAPPNMAQATTMSSYTISGLTVTGVSLAGNIATVATSSQAAQTYTVMVSGVTRSADAEPLTIASLGFNGILPFNVQSAAGVDSNTITVTFDAAPDPTEAIDIVNYNVPGLTLASPTLLGNTVRLETSAQSSTSYTIAVAGVPRASDGEPLTNATASFTGRTPFNVLGATSTTSQSVLVTFDAAPNAAQAMTLSNYSIPGLTVTGASLTGATTVTLNTSPQSATSFTLTVTGVARTDGEGLTSATAGFTGRAPFNVLSAAATSSTSVTVTFDAAPDGTQATTLANYAISGLTLSAPVLTGNSVTLTTSVQSAQSYTVVVLNVRRASDAEALTVPSVAFAGRSQFNVLSAASRSNTQITVTFDATPTAALATSLANYSVSGLTLSGTPTLSGNTVTINTTAQVVQSYTVQAVNVTRASDGEPMTISTATFIGKTGFNVISAASVSNTSMSVTFDAAPTASQAIVAANYSVSPGLTLSSGVLSGNTVTFTTSAQTPGTYTVTVSNVTRASDASGLSVNTASFTLTSFNVVSAAALSTNRVAVTFDGPPNMLQATMPGNYGITSGGGGGSLTITAATLSGNVVTLTTSVQSAVTYTVTVSTNVRRASDNTALTNRIATFSGRAAFNVSSATSSNSGTMTVTFSHAPTAAQATTLANYSVSGLTLKGVPVLSGNTVTISTSLQSQISYTVTVINVTRATDAEALTTSSVAFTGKKEVAPTVTNVVVQSTSPDNGTTFYNTGTAVVVITGTEFAGVPTACANNVKLDDTDGANVLVATRPTSCTVDGYSQITATFPVGIKTAGGIGWNVQVTNTIDTNATSSVRLKPLAGLLISEVYVGTSSGGNSKEFIEIYNPTNLPIVLNGSGNIGAIVHVMNGTSDTPLALAFVNGSPHNAVPSKGFLLLISSQSVAGEPWFADRDATYDASSNALSMSATSGVYISLATTAQTKVLDKVGWGASPPPNSFEGSQVSPTNGIPANQSIQRKPGGTDASTDTDNNVSDFAAPNLTLTPKGATSP